MGGRPWNKALLHGQPPHPPTHPQEFPDHELTCFGETFWRLENTPLESRYQVNAQPFGKQLRCVAYSHCKDRTNSKKLCGPCVNKTHIPGDGLICLHYKKWTIRTLKNSFTKDMESPMEHTNMTSELAHTCSPWPFLCLFFVLGGRREGPFTNLPM